MFDIIFLMARTDELLSLLKVGYEKILAGNLIGIYLHGSYVFGCYNERISDLDYIIVVKEALSFDSEKRLMEYTLDYLWPLSPEKGLEFHVLLLRDTLNFKQPLAFDFHFSKMHYDEYLRDGKSYIKRMRGKDPDLAAHIMVINNFGQVLSGSKIKNVFSRVPSEIYWQSILYDVDSARTEIVSQPMYVILNLCRALAYKKDHLITSKLSGGLWALEKIPKRFSRLIQRSLSEYRSQNPIFVGRKYGQAELEEFAVYMLKRIDNNQ